MKQAIDNELYFKIKTWLTPIDQTAKLDACIRARSPSTCDWLWNHSKVIEWKTTGGMFWCHAGMGIGKTILASHIIEILKDLPCECFVAYYYFEFTDPSTLSEEALFRSVVSQLSYTSEAVSRQLYEHHQHGLLQPQLKSLLKTLHELVIAATSPAYIVVDALDEVPPPTRGYLLESLLELSSLAENGVYVLVTSRDEVDIHQTLSGRLSLDFGIEKEMVQNDIITFVDQQLAARKWEFWPEQAVIKMRNVLIEKADGMFRLAACQMEVLNQTQSTEDMEHALATLPVTLGDTYLYILNKIPSHFRTRAHTLLCILSAALEPVAIAELSTLIAVELGDPADSTNLPVYRERLRYHEPQNIIGLGTALVRRTMANLKDVGDGEVLQLSHASVKEFLLQGTCSWCALNERLVEETIARACIALLIHSKDLRQTSGVADIKYSRHYWRRHVQSNHREQLLSQQKKLFETFPWPRSSIGESLWCFDDDFKAKGADVNSTTDDGTPILHNQAYSNRLYISQVLVAYGGDVNIVGGRYGSALQAAASRGALDVIKFLVESGADVNLEGAMYGSPFNAAHLKGHTDVARFLVESGATVNIEEEEYGQPLQESARLGALDVLKFLVESAAGGNTRGGYKSALEAAERG
ncbi:hypothetical protein DL96DRAFT_1465606 [Flagelloscypha sp. PMI_526]|nr:hypothetical protein DL96DRAFT_1465606 [Flagelloscypha sp. PMI_526]